MCEFTEAEDAVVSEDSIPGSLDWDIEPLQAPPFEPREKKKS